MVSGVFGPRKYNVFFTLERNRQWLKRLHSRKSLVSPSAEKETNTHVSWWRAFVSGCEIREYDIRNAVMLLAFNARSDAKVSD